MSSGRRRADETEAIGTDSFMDVVANLVGILIILVMVIGVRAQDAWVAKSQQPEAAAAEPPADVAVVAAARQELDNLTANVREIEQQASNLQQLAEQRRMERQQLQVLLTAADRELDDRRKQLDEQQQRQLALDTETRQLSTELSEITDQQQSLEQARQQPIILEHVPTPLAETVFGGEEHYRLKGGRLAYVPLNVLTEKLAADAPNKVDQLRSVPRITETIGPIQGFHLRYTMRRRNFAQFTKGGAMVRQVAELERFVLVPSSESMGEDLDTALRPDSQFQQQLAAYRPGETVITVWTYPDSFAEFGHLRRWLFERGFATAARPLPEGQPISGSPSGSRSAAQ